MGRFGSIAAMAQAGLNLRVWCLRCARGREIDAAEVGAPAAREPIAQAAIRFRCSDCRDSDMVILVPGSKVPRPQPVKLADLPYDPTYDGARAVAHFFHLMRTKKERSVAYPDRVTQSILARVQAHIEHAKRWPKPRLITVDGRLVRGRRIKLN